MQTAKAAIFDVKDQILAAYKISSQTIQRHTQRP